MKLKGSTKNGNTFNFKNSLVLGEKGHKYSDEFKMNMHLKDNIYF